MSKDVGKVSLRPMGVWSSSTTYEALDMVYYNGESFMSKVANTNVTPVDGDTWMRCGIQGEKGDNTTAEDVTYDSTLTTHTAGSAGEQIAANADDISELREDITHIKDMTSAEEQSGAYAKYHLGFYLDENGELCELED